MFPIALSEPVLLGRLARLLLFGVSTMISYSFEFSYLAPSRCAAGQGRNDTKERGGITLTDSRPAGARDHTCRGQKRVRCSIGAK
jgi:hypothetical protein